MGTISILDPYVNSKVGKMTEDQITEFIERAYKIYPLKVGKTKGVEKLKKSLASEDDCKEFFRALSRFIDYHAKKNTEAKYLPQFKTFVTTWKDWLDEDAGTAIEFQKNFDHLFEGLRGPENPKELT